MNYYRLFGIVIGFIFLSSLVADGQSRLDNRLSEMELFYYSPVELSYRNFKKGKTNYFNYDIRLRSRENKQEIFVILKSEDKLQNLANTPHIEFTRLIASIASNDQDENIVVKPLGDDKLDFYNASWGSEANFVLKNNISKYHKAKLLCFYKEGKGMVSLLYCYNEIPDLIRMVSFKD